MNESQSIADAGEDAFGTRPAASVIEIASEQTRATCRSFTRHPSTAGRRSFRAVAANRCTILKRFTIAVSNEELEDLHFRLRRARWPKDVQAGWDYGNDPEYLRELVDYWIERFDSRLQERRLNAFPRFLADVDGLRLHFVRQHRIGPRPIPLLLLHGWPGSFVQMLELVPLLTDPATHGGDSSDAFDVVVGSLPGYGFSDQPTAPGMSEARMADIFYRLMTETFGLTRFAVRGGDRGAGILAHVASSYPAAIIGTHTGERRRASTRCPQIRQRPSSNTSKTFDAGAPQRSGTLNDSPAGLASWIVGRYRRWSIRSRGVGRSAATRR